jgi:hypothetical protein
MSIAPATLHISKNPAMRRALEAVFSHPVMRRRQLRIWFESCGLSFREFGRLHGKSHQAISQAAAGQGSSHLQEAIAQAIGLEPWQLFPEHYDEGGNRLGRTREPYRITRVNTRNVEDGRAA